jgi:hypothetical protein
MKQIALKSALLALIISLVGAQPALAYIDPNTGGMLFQALAASFAVLTGFALLFSRQIRTLLGRARRSLRRTGVGKDQHTQEEAIDERNADGME